VCERKRVRVCASVRERRVGGRATILHSVCMCVRESVCACVRERVCAHVCECERDESGRKSYDPTQCVRVCERDCVRVFVRERVFACVRV